jgi:hypothetical protein
MLPKNRTRFICGMAMPRRRASIPNSGNQFWQGHTAIGREPVVKIKKPSGIVRFSADFAKAFGVRRTCREWSELGSRDIGGKTRRMRVRARTALGSELLELGPLLANVRSWALGSPQFPLLKTPAACSRTVSDQPYGAPKKSSRSRGFESLPHRALDHQALTTTTPPRIMLPHNATTARVRLD